MRNYSLISHRCKCRPTIRSPYYYKDIAAVNADLGKIHKLIKMKKNHHPYNYSKRNSHHLNYPVCAEGRTSACLPLGSDEGSPDGFTEGSELGWLEGSPEGSPDGSPLGFTDGSPDGH